MELGNGLLGSHIPISFTVFISFISFHELSLIKQSRFFHLVDFRVRLAQLCLLVLYLTMTDFSPRCFVEEYVIEEMKELKHEIDATGVSNIKEFIRKRLERWREVEVNIAVTGGSGSGKSSFINAIRE